MQSNFRIRKNKLKKWGKIDDWPLHLTFYRAVNTLFDQKLCYSRLHVKLKIHLAIEQDFLGRGIFT